MWFQVTIALMSHDGTKELTVQFCIAHCGLLAGHDLCATKTTGKLISDATGLPVSMYLSASQGGSQQIGARIAYNEIARLCDRYSIPFASNVATAEVLIQGLRRGDLDWRNIVNPHNH